MKKIFLLILLFCIQTICIAQVGFKVDSLIILHRINNNNIQKDTIGTVNGPRIEFHVEFYNHTNATINLPLKPELFTVYFWYRGQKYQQSLAPFGLWEDVGRDIKERIILLPGERYQFYCAIRPFLKTPLVKNKYGADHTLELLEIIPTLRIKYSNMEKGNEYQFETRGFDRVHIADINDDYTLILDEEIEIIP